MLREGYPDDGHRLYIKGYVVEYEPLFYLNKYLKSLNVVVFVREIHTSKKTCLCYTFKDETHKLVTILKFSHILEFINMDEEHIPLNTNFREFSSCKKQGRNFTNYCQKYKLSHLISSYYDKKIGNNVAFSSNYEYIAKELIDSKTVKRVAMRGHTIMFESSWEAAKIKAALDYNWNERFK
jgi:hypothetical protein